MKKKVRDCAPGILFPGATKILMKMKLTLCIILLSIFGAIASESYSQSTRLTLDLKNETLENVLEKIESKSEFYFLYSAEIVNVSRKVDINVKESTIERILDQLFIDTNISYNIKGRQIVLSAAKSESITSQQRTVSGKVSDAQGGPLPGVSVVVMGTTLGTITDASGGYSLPNVPSNAVLVFSFVGMKTQEIKVEGKTSINVKLLEESIGIDEVVAVGYGTQKKSSLTASVGSINAEELKAAPVANLTNSIGGRISGVLFTQISGEPGHDISKIYIRGIGTTGNTKPLYIVDGIPRDFSQLDPNSIESFSVLKDASAVAPYGMAGANGVVLVTTKRGKSGAPTLSYNAYYGIQNPTRITKFVNSYEYATMMNAADDNQKIPHAYSESDLQKFKDGTDPYLHPDHNVFGELITQNTPIMTHNIQLTGGADRIKYYIGLGYIDQKGMWGPSRFKRYNLVANIDAQATKTTKFSVSLNGRIEDGNQPGVWVEDIFYQAFRTPPIAPLTYPNGLPGGYIGRTAWGNIYTSGYKKDVTTFVYSQFALEQELSFIKGLSAKAVFSYDPGYHVYRGWQTPIPYYTANVTKNPVEYTVAGVDGPAKPKLTNLLDWSQQFSYQGYLTYQRTFGRHDVTGLIVLEARNSKYATFNAARSNYDIGIPELNNGSSASTDITNSGYSSEGKQRSALYRLTYSFASKYMIEASGRYDGNYYFAPGERFGFFPSFSVGWRMSEEGFIKNSLVWIDNLKLRGSYGESGALAGSPFQFMSSYNINGTSAVLGGAVRQGLYENSEPNTMITWERAKKSNIGLEATLWGGLFGFEFDYFFENRSNMLVNPTVIVPKEYGIGLSQVNAGAMKNHGFELTANSKIKINNDLRIDLSANFTYAKNKLTQVFESKDTYDNPNRRITGRPIGTLFGYKSLGYFQIEDDKNGNGIIDPGTEWADQRNGTVYPGDIKYQDTNNDKIIDAKDIVPIGRSIVPEIVYGFNPNIFYKGFDLNLLFQGAANRDIYLTNSAQQPFANSSSATKEMMDYWTPENRNAAHPRITTQPTTNNGAFSSHWVRDGSYVRLKTVEIGYTLPKFIITKMRIQSVRVFLSGQNVITWSKLKDFDPEMSDTKITSGMDAYRADASNATGWFYPQQKVYSIGANITF